MTVVRFHMDSCDGRCLDNECLYEEDNMDETKAHTDRQELLLIEAQKLHDREWPNHCDPKYIRSCPRFAQAILDAGTALREAKK